MAQSYPETASDAKDYVDAHCAERDFRATDDFRDYTGPRARGNQEFEAIDVIAIALIRIARALERLEVPLHVRALADEIDPPPPSSDTPS